MVVYKRFQIIIVNGLDNFGYLGKLLAMEMQCLLESSGRNRRCEGIKIQPKTIDHSMHKLFTVIAWGLVLWPIVLG